MEKRTFSAIAHEIKQVWPKPYFGAVPYINALLECNTTDPDGKYWFDPIRDVVNYFLANAATFRGEDARRIKAELKSMLK